MENWGNVNINDFDPCSLITEQNNMMKTNRQPDFITFKGLILPKARSNEGLSENEAYLHSGVEQIDYLVQNGLLRDHSYILDFGCGQGRLLNTLKYTGTKFQRYVGLDTSKASIDWCKEYLKYSDQVAFLHLPAANARYNPKETELKALPFQKDSFDLIFMNSVFSHMLAGDILFYLSEFHKVLRDEGSIYLTAFIEENVPNVEENPKGYIEESKGALHRVRYEKGYFFQLTNESGFKVKEFHYQGIERTKQSVVVLEKGGFSL